MEQNMKSQKSYALRVLIALDQFINVLILNGDEDHTISGRVGAKALITQKWYWLWTEKFINTLFWFDKDHCYNSIEWDRFEV